jgi:rubrerythrin
MATPPTHAELGFNRTGIATSPNLSEDMIQGTSEFPPPADGDEREIAEARTDYARDAEPIGTVPPPLSAKGVLKTAGTMLKGESPTQLIDKLGERLAFERTGTRMYEAVLSKLDALGSFEGGPTRADIEQIIREEYAHFLMLRDSLVRLGADPTVMTPSADVHATMTKGVLEVVVDPRTTLVQSLEAALLAELADNDCWMALQELSQQAGDDDLARTCTIAMNEEDQHLLLVRSWIAAAQGRTFDE